jgi:hypothetical protein
MTWPSSLPAKYDQGTFEERWPTGTVRTQTSIGPGKLRRRFTAIPFFMSGSMTLTASQAVDFSTFFYTMTQSGAEPFTWAHPRTGAAIQCEFADEIMLTDTEGGDVLATFSVKVLP